MPVVIAKLLLSLGLLTLFTKQVCLSYCVPDSCAQFPEIGEQESQPETCLTPIEPVPLELPPLYDCNDNVPDCDQNQGYVYEDQAAAGQLAAGYLHEFVPYNEEHCR